ncbi:DUF2231 domain-containing protein [Allosphingosinicella sp.]|jgi:uncharacterized membrane protein|uniref:DUF2231 domain-containing protein n=1 Tax=Allosphingosinicella sp. TaxID=2823234 RepID=UPI002F0B537D
MVLNLFRLMAVLLIAALVALSSAPGVAHKDHNEMAEANEQVEAPGVNTPGAMHEMMEEHAEEMEEQRPKTFAERLMRWIGRTHPFAVHFPIALFPVALVALILARRRGETIELIRALIIVAGAASVIAAILGWFTGGFVLVDTDAVQLWHRWIGTGLAVIGGAVAVWALRRRSSVNSRGMVIALSTITLILLVQGWLGAALVHGMDHMNF